MNRFLQKINTFMYGRYGRDELGIFLIICWFASAIVNIFANSLIVWIIGLAFAVLAFLRMLSKNTISRSAENRKFLKIWMPAKKKLTAFIRRVGDVPTHCYIRCPACKSKLRVPRISGKHTVNCPKCGHKFETTIHFKGRDERRANIRK